MPSPAASRSTRSNSQSNINLNDIQQLITSKIESAKIEIMSCLTESLNKINDTLLGLSSRVRAIEDDLLKISNKTAEHEIKIGNLHAEIEEIKTGFKVSEIIDEIERRNYRRLNLIVSGVPEQNHGSVGERKAYDECEISRILQELMIPSSKVKHIQRVGKLKPDRPRPIKLICASSEDRTETLTKGKTLKNSNSYKQIYINPDHTLMQQNEAWKLRQELRNRRNQGEEVVIYGGRVILKKDIKQNFH